MKRQIITTKDGSHTVAIPEMEVTYHSHNGALQESLHVFIDAGFRWLTSQVTASPLRIFEMGFGTGLNAFLTAQEAAACTRHIHYTAIEPYPLAPDEAARLNYAATAADKTLFEQLHLSPWHTDASITPFFTLHKLASSLQQLSSVSPVHLIYYDAFAPRAQPELWTEAVFRQLHDLLLPGGALVTYCSKSVVRRAMEAAGFVVRKIPGPRGKREMVRAVSSQPRS